MTSVTAVVPSHNGGDRLLRAVEALQHQTLPLAGIIVVDDASDDGSADQLLDRFPGICLVRLDLNAGPGAARNVGLRRAATELALLVDHDIYLERDCLERLARARTEWNAVAACPRIRLHPERDVVQADGAEPHFVGTLALRNGFRRMSELSPPRPTLVGALPSGCLLVERGPVLDAGGFDELIFFYFEDLELSLRLRGLGHRFVVVPSAEAYHDRGTGAQGLGFRGDGVYPARRLELTLRHRLLVLLVHYRLRTLLVLAPALLLYELASLAMAVDRRLAGEWARAWTWVVRHGPALLERRHRIQPTRTVADREILVGGALPLAPGVVQSGMARAAVRLLSAVLNAYWGVVRRIVG